MVLIGHTRVKWFKLESTNEEEGEGRGGEGGGVINNLELHFFSFC